MKKSKEREKIHSIDKFMFGKQYLLKVVVWLMISQAQINPLSLKKRLTDWCYRIVNTMPDNKKLEDFH